MDTALTIAEIKARFDGEWVLIEDPITDDNLEVQGGTVRFHSPDHREVYKKAAELHLPHSAIVFAGKMPKTTEFAL